MVVPETNIYFVETVDGFNKLKEYIQDTNPEYFSLDLETDGLNERTAKIFGIGLCFKDNEAFYIPIRNNKKEVLWDNLTKIYSWIALQTTKRKLIGWNLIYDTLVFEFNSGIFISQNIYSDGILLKHTVAEDRPFGLKENAIKYLGPWADKAQKAMIDSVKANGGSTTKDNFEMWKADLNVLGEYCAWDTILAFKLFIILEKKLFEEKLDVLFYQDEIMPLYREVTIPMKRRGFPVDLNHFNKLKVDITKDIEALEDKIQSLIAKDVAPFCQSLLNKDYPIRKTGTFPKILAELNNVPLPTKDGKVTLSKSALAAFAGSTEYKWYYCWLLGEETLDHSVMASAQLEWAKRDTERKHLFNLSSTDHLGWLLFTHFGEEPLSKTDGGKPQCDDELLESFKDKYEFIALLIDYKKLNKLLSTYIEGILSRQYEGVIYTSMLQYGTTSGRYSSASPNLQNIPRIKDEESNLSALVLSYVNAIKKGFVAPEGYVIVNADYSSLEPVCFAHMSGSEGLRDVFRKGEDLYSRIAIDVNSLQNEYSASKKAPNFLKKHRPELRQLWKVPTLGIVYGMEEYRLCEAIGCEYQEATEIIHSYLTTYPELKDYMDSCDKLAKTAGMAKSQYGRIRHLPIAKSLYEKYGEKLSNRKWVKQNGLGETRYHLKNALNNSKNFPIQGLAAHIVNRAMIEIEREFIKNKIDGGIVLTIHDEVTCIVRKDQAEQAKNIVKYCMENTIQLSVPLSTEPLIADNWAEAK